MASQLPDLLTQNHQDSLNPDGKQFPPASQFQVKIARDTPAPCPGQSGSLETILTITPAMQLCVQPWPLLLSFPAVVLSVAVCCGCHHYYPMTTSTTAPGVSVHLCLSNSHFYVPANHVVFVRSFLLQSLFCFFETRSLTGRTSSD